MRDIEIRDVRRFEGLLPIHDCGYVDEKLVFKGSVPSKDQVRQWLKNA